ncbi:MAG: LysM peptidoglycan-binding domain-containing protein [Kiritimatiellales bacterium]|nr:LysM peptidoglycan-binding domain-containing protein [Kiritimatiellales bacterium]
MKVGSAVVAAHVAVVCMFALTQGCVTTESQGSGRGAGARHKGPWRHEHKGKAASSMMDQSLDFGQGIDQGDEGLYSEPLITSTSMGSTVEPSPTTSYPGQTEVYIVQKGDILSQLAVDFDTTTSTLVELNQLSNPDVLYVGQELRVPSGRSGAARSTTKKSIGAVRKGGTYTIQKGDTLSEIALAAGVGIDDLRALNNFKNDKIFAGEKLDIPDYGKVPSATRKAATSVKEPAPVEPSPAASEPAPAPIAVAPAVSDVEPVDTSSAAFDIIEEKVLYPNETLDEVAAQYGVSKAEIMRLNNITDETQVREGQRLRIPVAE